VVRWWVVGRGEDVGDCLKRRSDEEIRIESDFKIGVDERRGCENEP